MLNTWKSVLQISIETDLNDSRQYGFSTVSRVPVSNRDDNWDITCGKLLVISPNNNFWNCDLNSTKHAFVYAKYGAITRLSRWQKTKVSTLTEGKRHFSVDFHANRRRWHIRFILALSPLTGSSEREKHYAVCTTPLRDSERQTERWSERVKGESERLARAKETALWLRPETRCHPECVPGGWKGGRERGTSIRPLHRNEQDVWTQLCT